MELKHLIHYFEEPENALLHQHISRDVIEEIEEMHADFGCEKVKIFSTDGTVIYSTDSKDIGSINTRAYFKPVVTQGVIHTKLVEQVEKPCLVLKIAFASP